MMEWIESRGSVLLAVGLADMSWRYRRQAGRAHLGHDRLELAPQDREHRLDTVLAEGCEPPQVGSADAHGRSAEGDGLEDVRTSAKAAVDQDRDSTPDGSDDLRKRRDRGEAAVLQIYRESVSPRDGSQGPA